MNKTILLSLLILFSSVLICAQATNDFVEYADSLFTDVDKSDSPGVAACVIKDGKAIYLKGFGSANLETGEPISPKTKFQLGELSKQFTSLAILILEEQGVISYDDDIRNYLQELPEYAQKITIRHLLNHSSGLHDINRINAINNGRQVISNQAKAIEIVAAQNSLSFIPGTEFSFHEAVTESVLMAEIVARSSGLSFPEFVETNIFQPLGMNNSLIRDDSESILSDVAVAYRKEEGEEYKENGVRSNVLGAINAYSSAEDMFKWYLNFEKPEGSLGRMIQKLDDPVQLTNGKHFDYYWGTMTIGRDFLHPERGLPKYWNFGFQGGYGCNVFRFMEEGIISFVLGNSNQYNGAYAMNVIDPYLNDNYLLPATIDNEALKTIKMNTSDLESFAGNYWFKKAGYASRIYVENDTLRSQWLFSKRSSKLVPLSDDTFQQIAHSDEVRTFKFIEEGNSKKLLFKYNDSDPDIMRTYVPFDPSTDILNSCQGTYYSNAYKSLIVFQILDGQLVARNKGHKGIKFKPVTKDVFTSATSFMPALEFLRDKSDVITGIKINGDGVNGLVFKKAN